MGSDQIPSRVNGFQSISSGFGFGYNICKTCIVPALVPPVSPTPQPMALPPTSSPSTSKVLRRGLLAFAIVGSVGAFAGICTLIYCLYTGVLFGRKKIHNSVQPTITRGGSSNARTSSNSPPSRSLTIRRQGSIGFRRQRSGTSSTKHPDRAEEFTFQELASATDDFSLENKIGAGSFGVVYRGKLADGRVVAIKRGETGPKTKKYQEKESAFESELAFLSRVHHKHLVRLVGYCEERDERLLVYEYMKNGALYDHLHDKKNIEKGNSVVNAWKIRIKIALDAARGIEYLHNYAVPPIIHRDIKSSNILLDIDWTARVSDFGLSLLNPESDQDYRPTKAAGTVGYIDPEYYGLNVLTTKSDVYGLGVVLLELLTGKRAIFKEDSVNGDPISVVDYAVPAILAGELLNILDPRVGPPESNESEAVELVAYTALHCVNLEGKDRPTMNDIVANLERAWSHCDDSHGSISSAGIISIESD
ncbi:putative serine/threonine-protein kinase-like protein CCR3 [Bienertia sinuspersici]